MWGSLKLWSGCEGESGRQVSKQPVSKGMLPCSYGNAAKSFAPPLLSVLLCSQVIAACSWPGLGLAFRKSF